MELDLSNSISDRNIQLEQTLLDKLLSEYIQKYIVQMNRLDTVKTFIHDNTYHNIESGHHIAYKYIVNKDSDTPTRLITKDGSRAYEFLLEFDKKDPSYGIYYGCRGLILNGDQEEQIETMLKEWEVLRPSILTVLNNTFPTMDFTNRFQPTNNANNKTFWPFWIALGIEEDILDVAIRATTIIAKTYIEYFTNNNLLHGFSNEQKEKVAIKTYFTNDAYNSILKELDDKVGKGGIKLSKYFKDFIHTGQKYNVFKSVKQYEKCFQFTKLDTTECGLFFEALSNKLNIFVKGQIPWSYYIPLFLSKDGEMLTYAKNNVYYKKNYAKNEYESMKEFAEEALNKCLKFR